MHKFELEYHLSLFLFFVICWCSVDLSRKIFLLLQLYCSSKFRLLFSFLFRNKEPVGTWWSCIYRNMQSSVGGCYFGILCCVCSLLCYSFWSKRDYFPWESQNFALREYFTNVIVWMKLRVFIMVWRCPIFQLHCTISSICANVELTSFFYINTLQLDIDLFVFFFAYVLLDAESCCNPHIFHFFICFRYDHSAGHAVFVVISVLLFHFVLTGATLATCCW